jgi:hypothetical protein
VKRDTRKFDHKTLEEICRVAVERVRCATIYNWLRAVKSKGRGLND